MSVRGKERAENMEEKRYYRVDYRGKAYEFVFQYKYDSKNGYRAFIVKAPGYRFRSSDLSATHRLKRDNAYCICWSERISSKAKLDAVVELWCKATVMYIVHGGKSIDAHAAKLMNA